jgi:glutathione S-transferase
VAREADLQIALERVDTKELRTETGVDYRTINPQGYVPVLQLDEGGYLTEAAVIVQYLADRRPEKGLMAAFGTLERYRQMEWLNFTATELHKTFRPLIKGGAESELAYARQHLGESLDVVARQLEGRDYLFGKAYTAPDAYTSVVLGWARFIKFDLARWPSVGAYLKRVRERPAVRAALQAEGLLTAAPAA